MSKKIQIEFTPNDDGSINIIRRGDGKGRPQTFKNCIKEPREGYSRVKHELLRSDEAIYAPDAPSAETPMLYMELDASGAGKVVSKGEAGGGRKAAAYEKVETDRVVEVDGEKVNLNGHWLAKESVFNANLLDADTRRKATAKRAAAKRADKVKAEKAAELQPA